MKTKGEIEQAISRLSKQLPGYKFPCTREEEYETTRVRTGILARIAALRWTIDEQPKIGEVCLPFE